jgi:hypothetical protein
MTYACPAWELAADNHLLKLQRLQNKVLRTTGNFPRSTSARELHVVSNFRTYTIKKQNYASSKQKSYKIMKMQMFAILHEANPYAGNKRGLNLTVVKLATVQVIKLPL